MITGVALTVDGGVLVKNDTPYEEYFRHGRLAARGRAMRAAVAWLKTPAGGVTVLVFATLLARFVLASALGLGIDES